MQTSRNFSSKGLKISPNKKKKEIKNKSPNKLLSPQEINKTDSLPKIKKIKDFNFTDESNFTLGLLKNRLKEYKTNETKLLQNNLKINNQEVNKLNLFTKTSFNTNPTISLSKKIVNFGNFQFRSSNSFYSKK